MAASRTVDCRGLACPQPVIHTKEALERATASFRVIVDNEGSCTNVSRFAESRGARVSIARRNDEFHLTIEPGEVVPDPDASPRQDAGTESKNLVVYISSEGMGRGDDDLGATLMEAFLDTLSHFKGELSHAVFVNAAAKLAVEGSPVLEQVRQLEQMGVEVLVCGTCLDHFGIRNKLAVGTVSNMYAIIETLSKAGRIIRP
jgi:selenium metabolism protein YedF